MNGISAFYPMARRFYEIPSSPYLNPKKGPEISTQGAAGQGASGWFRNEVKAALNYDFSRFVRVDFGKWRVSLPDIPKGTILLLLFPATVGPRLFRAWQRGRENHDYREVWDVMRRDMTAITLLLYAMPLLQRGLSGLLQKQGKINLLDGKNGKVLAYSQLRNYHVDNPKVLRAIIAEHSGTALHKAVEALHDNGLSQLGHPEVAERLKQLKASVGKLVKLHESGPTPEGELARHAEETFTHFERTDKAIQQTLTRAYEQGSSAALDAARNLQGRIKGVLQHYAKVRRLPVDMVSLAAAIGLIGWLPVWFNSQWNLWRFQQKMVAEEKSPPANHSAALATTAPPVRTVAQPVPAPLPMERGMTRAPMTTSPFQSYQPSRPQFRFPQAGPGITQSRQGSLFQDVSPG